MKEQNVLLDLRRKYVGCSFFFTKPRVSTLCGVFVRTDAEVREVACIQSEKVKFWGAFLNAEV